MNTGQTIGTIDGRRGHGLDSAKSVLQWRFQRRMPDMESGEKHHPIEAGQGVGTLCQSTALRAWHRGLHWRALHWARFGRAQSWPGVTACASIHGKAARPLVAGRKTGATDARAIWLAVQQPGTNEVGWPK
ncbi:hypothetical protein D5045_19075 [Verminephrobacter eiseniae]|uniref:hypothetical protein n=1 Tax=Verminephrobacter eiseniae TaxID=364317 RepID=UPI00223735D1|nr:hypothetical protein [Verminephrobacter eiseniae]MCW5262182.1 hypothetical protein [Verminephrobacter eiseniae]